MNKYKIKFQAICPVNEDVIEYSLTIESIQMIEVERITDAIANCKRGFHELFADFLHQKFGGYQIMTAFHGGVLIETTRGQPR